MFLYCHCHHCSDKRSNESARDTCLLNHCPSITDMFLLVFAGCLIAKLFGLCASVAAVSIGVVFVGFC